MTSPTSRQASITINSSALTHNLSQVRRHAPDAKVLAMVKASAYGHGVAHCLPALQDADAVGVATFDEAIEVRQLGWDKPIVMIEGVFSEREWQQAIKWELTCVIQQQQQVTWALAHQPTNTDATNDTNASLPSIPAHPSQTVWLKLNSGMSRLGFNADEILCVAQQLHDAGYHLVLTSHFANADLIDHPLNQQQIDTFNSVLTQLRTKVSSTVEASLCNSAAIINFPECHYNWVRPGIMLYGSSPFETVSATKLNLRPVMTFSTALMAVHDLDAGEVVGYGSRFTAAQPMKKGIISIGYGDGYPRVVSEAAWVSLYQDGHYYPCPILGRVAMDMVAIDLSAVPSPKLGSQVILWGHPMGLDQPSESVDGKGSQVPSVDDVAAWANTLGYELLCRITQRPKRNVVSETS
ncbi:alanine racemase [Psychrobacter pygoscelis]|uniref:alanine racemase n=1 Tax=Psychrobacter pygoscelis TaxID=2488563 RepID=UPI00103EA77A|nr:alanine racemase [Psychrobacter pygoscelis]